MQIKRPNPITLNQLLDLLSGIDSPYDIAAVVKGLHEIHKPESVCEVYEKLTTITLLWSMVGYELTLPEVFETYSPHATLLIKILMEEFEQIHQTNSHESKEGAKAHF